MLGPLEVRDGDHRPVALPRRQQRALLAALLVRAGEVVSVDRLVDDLWGESPPASAVGSLQNTISQLRKLLGPDVLRTHAPGYVLDVPPDAIDARRFERLVAAASGVEAGPRANALHEALALWRGDALADLVGEPWAEREASRLEELRLAALEERIEAELELGRHGALVADLEPLTVGNPSRERLHRQLALALYRSGRQQDALRALEWLRKALDNVGLEPTVELRQLERDILNHSPAVAAPREVEGTSPPEAAGERRLVSVLAADLPVEEDPELSRALLDRVGVAAIAAVRRHGGELERVGPEGLVAVFGVEASREDDALRAVRAGVELHEATGASVGVATGEAIVGGEPRVTGGAVARAAGLARIGAGVLVGPRTLALVRNAVTVEESKGVARVLAVNPARPDDRAETPFVGRETERARLRDSLARPVVVLTVIGEPGIGKTRLARELVATFAGLVLEGRCAAYGDGATFVPLIDAISGVDVEATLAGAGDAELVGKRIVGLAGGAHEPGSLGETYWAVRRLLESLAAGRPVLLVLDDVHWAEPALLDLVEYLEARVTEAPLAVLCLARPELLEARPGWAAQSFTLEPLGDDETLELVGATAELEPDARERIVELAEGNPLYAQQLATYAAESGKALEPGAMPATIDAVLAGRIGRLEAGERGTLQRAAVVGREFSRGAVAALAPPDLAVDAHLLALTRRGFVRPLREPLPGDDAYRFHHVLLRDAAYATLTKEQRADLHERAAGWLDRDGRGEDAIVGYHLEQAASLRRSIGRDVVELSALAGERLGRAGYRSFARGDTHAGLALLRRAVALLPSGSRRAELLWELAIAYRIVGRPIDATATLDEAATEADANGDRRVAARVVAERMLWRVSTETAAPADVLASTGAVLQILEEENDPRGQGRAWLAIQAAHNFRCEMELMAQAAARAEECARSIDFSTAAALGAQAAALYHGPTPAPAAIAGCLELLDRARDRTAQANVLAQLGALHGLLARFAEAHELLEESRAGHEAVGLTLARHASWAHCAFELNRLAGAADQAEAIARASLEALLALGEHAYAATRALQLAELLIGLDELDEAGRLTRLAKRHTSKHDVLVQFMLLRVEARLEARAGHAGRAESLARRAVATAEPTDDLSARAATMAALAEVLTITGRADDAATAAEGAEALFRRKGDVAGLARARPLLRAGEPV